MEKPRSLLRSLFFFDTERRKRPRAGGLGAVEARDHSNGGLFAMDAEYAYTAGGGGLGGRSAR